MWSKLEVRDLQPLTNTMLNKEFCSIFRLRGEKLCTILTSLSVSVCLQLKHIFACSDFSLTLRNYFKSFVMTAKQQQIASGMMCLCFLAAISPNSQKIAAKPAGIYVCQIKRSIFITVLFFTERSQTKCWNASKVC